MKNKDFTLIDTPQIKEWLRRTRSEKINASLKKNCQNNFFNFLVKKIPVTKPNMFSKVFGCLLYIRASIVQV
jgi:hypothetical protein